MSDRFNFRGANLTLGQSSTNVNLVNVEFDDIENICETVEYPEPTGCLTITGQNSSLFGSNFEGLEVKLIDFGDPELTGSDGGIIDFQLVNFTLADFSELDLTEVIVPPQHECTRGHHNNHIAYQAKHAGRQLYGCQPAGG